LINVAVDEFREGVEAGESIGVARSVDDAAVSEVDAKSRAGRW
jgi:hypothetical protein